MVNWKHNPQLMGELLPGANLIPAKPTDLQIAMKALNHIRWSCESLAQARITAAQAVEIMRNNQ